MKTSTYTITVILEEKCKKNKLHRFYNKWNKWGNSDIIRKFTHLVEARNEIERNPSIVIHVFPQEFVFTQILFTVAMQNAKGERLDIHAPEENQSKFYA